jgi:uncharacterized protein
MNPQTPKISRRTMLGRSAHAGAAALAAGGLASLDAAEPRAEDSKPLVWDMHGHLSGVSGTAEERISQLLKYADRMGIDRLIVFMGLSWSADPTPERFRQENDDVLKAVKHSGGRAFGFVYLNPKYPHESVAEFDRCVRDGPMVGVKLWIARRCNHETLDPICRRAAELQVPVLQHTYVRTIENLPGESTPSDLAQLARRHPDVQFISAHIGNNWERGVRAVRANQNVYAEVSGSDPTAGMVEMLVREVGAARVMYGSDFGGRSFASQLAKVHGAEISEGDKRLILGGNIERVLAPIFKAKGIKI